MGITKAYHVETPEQIAEVEKTIEVEFIRKTVAEDGETFELEVQIARYNGEFIQGAYLVNGKLWDGIFSNEKDIKETLEYINSL